LRVFVAGIMQGSLVEMGIHDQDYRVAIGAAIKARFPEAEVIDPLELHPDGGVNYGPEKAKRTLLEMAEEAARADVLIAYLPEASMGTAVEIYEAHRGGAAVVTITPMSANWVVRAYSDRIVPDLKAFDALAASGELARLVEDRARA